jgi:hypothetical protein
MYITAFFTNLGTPQTGLSPTIRIWNVATSALVVTDEAMTEVALGWYKYNFSTYDATKEYIFRCNGGALLLDAERYIAGGTDEPDGGKIADAVWDEPMTSHVTLGTAGLSLETIRQVETGKWTISGSTMTLYKDNGTTVLLSFTLKDKNGSAIVLDDGVPAERDPV